MPSPYISFRTFLILLCLPIIILKTIQREYHLSLLFIQTSFQWIIFNLIPLIGVYVLIGILVIPTSMFSGTIMLTTYIIQVLATLLERYNEWQNRRIPRQNQDQNESDTRIQNSPLSPCNSDSGSTSTSSSGVCTPTTPIDLDVIEQWQLDVSHWPSPEFELELEDELEYLKEPADVAKVYLPLKMDLEVPSLYIDGPTVRSDITDEHLGNNADIDLDRPPTTAQDHTLTHTPTDEEIDALLMKSKALNIKHALLLERRKMQMKRDNQKQKFQATFHGDLPRGGKRVSKMGGLGVIHE
ncbi:hypothetical protein I302_107147 [Kwoniella bestiolae CBS 10118]|uniref:Uncharacterized protein n=1 Tax=Kwoniella bestiolae CBS 10118 TaxID=1296100 RepID=A0A1B9FZC4_9TREE|nr:hypothetical protein I302_05586 [Kwoniella bestiolae CBS 10118]OCF24128.1 hypothetical protein I302_05586 [Kwoniella bestiolae CBS 10118]